MIQLEIWVFCILLVLALLGSVIVFRYIWFAIEQLSSFVSNYKKYKKFYYENADNSFQKYLEELNEKAKTQKEREKEDE